MHIMSMAVPEASLRLRGWMDGHKGKQSIQLYEKQHKTKGGAQALFTHCVSDYFSYTLSSIIHTLLGNAYAEADVVLKKKGTDKEEDAQVTRPRCYIKSSPLRSSHCGTMVCSAAVLRVISSSFFCHLISSSQGPTVHFQCSCTPIIRLKIGGGHLSINQITSSVTRELLSLCVSFLVLSRFQSCHANRLRGFLILIWASERAHTLQICKRWTRRVQAA